MTTGVVKILESDWLELLPDDVGDEQYRADVRAEAVARARRGDVDQMLAGLEEQLARRAGDPSTDPVMLLGLASDVQAARAVRVALPPLIAVDARRHERVITELQRRLPQFRLPPPPRLAVELRHWRARHSSGTTTLPPEPITSDKEVIGMYEEVSAALARFEARRFAFLRQPWRAASSIADWVRVWHAAMNDDELPTWRQILAELLPPLELNEKLRSEQAPHLCEYGSADTFRLQPPTASEPWTYREAALRGVLMRG